MLDFLVNQERCTRCGQCVADCPAQVITMAAGDTPTIPAAMEAACYRCQHCFTLCPTGAVSILGLKTEESHPLAGNYPDPGQLEILMKGRRSVRRYKEENLDPALLQQLLEVAWHAPTGVNCRSLLLTVVDDRIKMAQLRDEVLSGLAEVVKAKALPAGRESFADFVRLWEEERVDILFRGAPHLLVASVPSTVKTPLPDCLIALSYFELLAQAYGVGTLWDGLAKRAIDELVPSVRKTLGIPDDHLIGYVMAFGKPAVYYARTAQHRPALIQRLK